jgi:hypothetical protein
VGKRKEKEKTLVQIVEIFLFGGKKREQKLPYFDKKKVMSF